MKKTFILAFALLIFLAMAVVVKSAATVNINPSAPSDNDNLVCTVAGSDEDFDFYWFKNGQQFRTDYGAISTINSADTNPGDEWKCVVYTPLGNQVGEDTVNIPGPSTGDVIITPSNPFDEDALTCSVAGSDEDFDFYWFKNGQQFRVDYGANSIINADETSPGENWKCVVYTPLANKVGEASVLIDSTKIGIVMIEPQMAYTNNDLTAFVNGINENFVYNWYKNDQLFKTETAVTSKISASDTTKHDVWTVKVYTPLNNEFIGEDSVEILNSAPTITSFTMPSGVNAGETVNVEFSATDADGDGLYYYIYRDNEFVSSKTSDSWITSENDAGQHMYTVYASDEEDYSYQYGTVNVIGSGYIEPKKEVKIYNLGISAVNTYEGTYLKIRNLAHSIENVVLKVSSIDSNQEESFSLDIDRNLVKVIPLDFNLAKGNYLIRIEVISEDFDGSDYLLVEA